MAPFYRELFYFNKNLYLFKQAIDLSNASIYLMGFSFIIKFFPTISNCTHLQQLEENPRSTQFNQPPTDA